jgi:hypothetical protein
VAKCGAWTALECFGEDLPSEEFLDHSPQVSLTKQYLAMLRCDEACTADIARLHPHCCLFAAPWSFTVHN